MLFPRIEACKFVALQTPFAFMQQTGYRPALTRGVQDQRDALANLGQRHRRCPFFSPDGFLLRTSDSLEKMDI